MGVGGAYIPTTRARLADAVETHGGSLTAASVWRGAELEGAARREGVEREPGESDQSLRTRVVAAVVAKLRA